jgi:hypothetical protein
MSGEFYGIAFIAFVGVIFAIYFAGQTFKEAVALHDVPTPLDYLVRRNPLRLGQFAFVCFCLAIYVFALVFYRQLPQLVEFLPDEAKNALKGALAAIGSPEATANEAAAATNKRTASLLVIVLAITTAFLYVIRTSFKGNIIFSFRSLVYDWIAVPIACQHASDQLLANLQVAAPERQTLANVQRLHIDLPDFEQPAGPIKKQWAELAYMNRWVREQRAQNQTAYVFLSKTFDFDQLHREFLALRELTRAVKTGPQDDEAIAAALDLLKDLRAKHARYVACIIMSISTDRVDFYNRCSEVGINPGLLTVENPLRYSLQFVIALLVTIVLGPYLFAVGYELSQNRGLVAFTDQNFIYLGNWLLLGFAIYFLPIFVVLLVRYISWLKSPVRQQVSLTIYASTFLGVLFLSLLGATLTTLFLRHGLPANWTRAYFIDAAWRNAPWTIPPALTAVYINSYLDRQADPSKKDIDQRRGTVIPRLLMALAYTAGVALLAMVIVSYQQVSEQLWPRPEARLIVVGTTALVNLLLCLVAQFGLKKPEQVPDTVDALG